MKAEKEYVPFGEEWKDELMKMSKIHIISFLRSARLEIEEMQEYSDHSAKERFDRAMEHYRNIPVGDIVIKRGVSLKAKEALQIAAYGDTKTEEG